MLRVLPFSCLRAARACLESMPSFGQAGIERLFGDGSVTIVATPGHTPGHQSLLIRLPKTGAHLLSGDAVHFQGQLG